jgi:hypothetical protein
MDKIKKESGALSSELNAYRQQAEAKLTSRAAARGLDAAARRELQELQLVMQAALAQVWAAVFTCWLAVLWHVSVACPRVGGLREGAGSGAGTPGREDAHQRTERRSHQGTVYAHAAGSGGAAGRDAARCKAGAPSPRHQG